MLWWSVGVECGLAGTRRLLFSLTHYLRLLTISWQTLATTIDRLLSALRTIHFLIHRLPTGNGRHMAKSAFVRMRYLCPTDHSPNRNFSSTTPLSRNVYHSPYHVSAT